MPKNTRCIDRPAQPNAEQLKFYEDSKKKYKRLKVENNGITLDELSERLAKVTL